MIKIFETAQVKKLDQYTVKHERIESIDLIERASVAFVNEFCHHFSKRNHVIVFAGQGNNGADALAIARLLQDEGYQVEAYLFNPAKHVSADCEINKQRLLAEGNVRLTAVIEDFTPPILGKWDVVIDGLFGSGLNRPLTGGYAAVVQYINRSEATVVAIDIPSGLFGEDNSSNDPNSIICADYTYTFEFPKLAFVLPENASYVGKWKTLPVGIHPEIIAQTETPYIMVTEEDMEGVIIKRNTFDHKGTFGHALLIAGSKGKMGAAVLSATACLRSGAGRLTVHVPERGEAILQTAIPEAMVSLDQDKDYVSGLPTIKDASAIAIGPGLGVEDMSLPVLESLLKKCRQPLILDADALNLIAGNIELLYFLPPHTILTPHPKEFDRMFGNSADGYERLHRASAAAIKHQSCIVLKGAYTAVCTLEGNIYVNPTGNPGMATAGSGDVLTGVILGLLAQGYSPETSAVLGVYLHGAAGDFALLNNSEESLIAGDIISMLGKAFKMHKE
ncbi:MAG: NAD(P)H-hydrate dehydratase [Tannerella sp.]|jgi:NAD(P)H-hydrate epimerase|nr:NAD(P)H-hydrate dehydratase [Tannerella sp.]